MLRLLTSCVLLAQVPGPMADPLQGWGGLILQGGAFLLLTYIVVVLSPQMIREARKEREATADYYGKTIDALQQRFEGRNTAIVQALQAQTQALQDTFERGMDRLQQSVGASCKGGQR